MPLDREKLVSLAKTFLGHPYKLGSKWAPGMSGPKGPIDCSGFVRWLYKECGVDIVDGSYNQFDLTVPCDSPLHGDLGFFRDEFGTIDHVGIVYDKDNMVEARGDPFNKVILRPRAKWEAWHGFTGYRRAKGA